MAGYEPKDDLFELDDPDFHVCDAEGCKNSATPFVAPGGDRYCLTHAQK
jgi:hypothetical protein